MSAPQQVPPELTRRQALSVIAAVIVVIGLLGAVVVAAVRLTHRPAAAASADVLVFGPVQYRPVINNAAVQVASTPVRMGNWTPARGVTIAERALGWLSWPYSFDGGNAAGPTYGRPVDHASRNDGHILGFDCSGLVIYAVAPWTGLDHSAAAQYTEAGSFHPAVNSLQPGDLVFWSQDGTIAGIGHVAIYIGNGNVVQAPHSGGQIEVTPIDQVESGSVGITRPLT
jgi:cell wall-associated NlpC family hydrolase